VDLKEIKDLLRYVTRSGFQEFELKQGDFSLRVKRPDPAAAEAQTIPAAAWQVTASPAPPPAAATRTAEAAAPPVDEKLHLVTSPIIGTFYRAPSPGADPFVGVGSRVSPGSVLCIVEAMKIMNEIECDVAGTVEKIWAENGEPVEYGENLFSIRLD
jgi:acetyl-CoA carboxylase biotin carboxyl carrier protein